MTIRWKNALHVLPALALAGCGSLWTPEDYPDEWVTDQIQTPYFYDLDGDGWGSPDQDPQNYVEPEGNWTARNGLDCDDGDASVGARLGTLCPGDLTGIEPDVDEDGNGEDDRLEAYQGFVTSTSEYVLVRDPGLVSYGLHAEAACAAWGGMPVDDPEVPEYTAHLATFGSASEFAPIRDALEGAGGDDYVGFVGIAPIVDAEGAPIPDSCDQAAGECACSDDDAVCWTWSDESDSKFVDVASWCGGTPPANASLDRAALLYDGADDSVCLGSPDQLDGNDWSEAHFVCQRPMPDTEAFDWWPADDEA